MILRLLTIFAAFALVSCTMTQGGAKALAPPSPYRDLNHNHRLDPYEDPRLSHAERVEDLLRRMTLEEKVGTLLHGIVPGHDNSWGLSSKGYNVAAADSLIRERGVTSMLSRITVSPTVFAEQNNAVQRAAAGSRLGIPVTISTDPRNHFAIFAGGSNAASGFSQWPEGLGFGALRDEEAVRRFASIAAGEYRAVGLHMALSPQSDLLTEPRWSRGTATFGSDPATVSKLSKAYIEGFQGSADGLRSDGVATVAKHWVGYGAEPEGLDAHSYYGRHVVLTDESFALHLQGFQGVLEAKSSGVMPTYAIVSGVSLDGKPLEPVGAGFSHQLLTDLLRGRFGYDGLIVSDWGIVDDCPQSCSAPTADNPGTGAFGMPWGVETLTREQRVAKAMAAGIDQFGGLDDPAPVLAAVKHGLISVERIDQSVRRVLMLKFRLGLFDNPFVDPAEAGKIVGSPATLAEAESVQAKALVLLENRKALLPLSGKPRIWLHGVDPGAAQASGLEVASDIARADLAVVRMAAPYQVLHPYHVFGKIWHEGSLAFRDDDPAYAAFKSVAGRLPTVVIVDLERPAILGDIARRADALIGAFGASDRAVLDAVTGKIAPQGKLPLELPRDMASVERQRQDLPDDSERPLYPRGFGLSFPPNRN